MFPGGWEWLVVLAIVLLIFGAGKLPSVMGDVAKGIKKFKAGMAEDPNANKKTIDA
ncbi:MAG TPA: twin-arginine translocase TatA/TatE family subunit, partial [Alphaproteobacteria bacterium]|nr:twin-arginine translocase TatA/TatE family subunit [Alphaproteobacteria bacterium]